MKKFTIGFTVFVALLSSNIFTSKASAQDIEQKTTLAIHRVYNPNSGEHLFTPSSWETDYLLNIGWKYESVGFVVPYRESWESVVFPNQGQSVFRIYNKNAGEHFYTSSSYEMQSLIDLGWKNDWLAFPTAKKGIPVYRLYNPNVTVGSHHYTINTYERDNLIRAGWKYEGVAFNVLR